MRKHSTRRRSRSRSRRRSGKRRSRSRRRSRRRSSKNKRKSRVSKLGGGGKKKKSKRPSKGAASEGAPAEGCTQPSAFNCYLRFFQQRNHTDYDENFVRTAEILAGEGLTCDELLNVNLQTNEPLQRARAYANNYQMLRAYARDVRHMTNHARRGFPDDMILNTALSLLHEMYYVALQDGSKAPANLGITENFAKGAAVEALAEAFMTCPECPGKLHGEHLQHRGDLYCDTCNVDIDVKSSHGGAQSHCKAFRNTKDVKKQMKTWRTPYAAYMRNIAVNIKGRKEPYLVMRLLDCQTGQDREVTDYIPDDMLWHIVNAAMRMVRPYANHIKKLAKQLGKVYERASSKKGCPQ